MEKFHTTIYDRKRDLSGCIQFNSFFLASVPNKETDKKDFGINFTISIHSVHSLDEPIKQSERNELINNKMNIRYTNENQKKKNYSEINSRNPCFTVRCKLQQTDS